MHVMRSLQQAAWFVATLAVAAPTASAQVQMNGQIDPTSGMVTIEQQSLTILKTEIPFWHGEWKWAGPATRTTALDDKRGYRIEGRHLETGLDVAGEVRFEEETPDRTTIRMTLKAEESPEGAADVFGALVFKVNPAEAASSAPAATPVINDDKTGWSLNLGPDRDPLEVTFDRPIERLEFEQGNTREIRAYLLELDDRHDTAEISAEISFPGKAALAPEERLGSAVGHWPVSELHWNRTPIDLSFLNEDEKPAGKRGFIRADGEKLVFEDGTPVRFWGTNVTAYSLFQFLSPKTVQAQAKRLSQLGFNLVRIHHHDSAWVNPNIFGLDAEQTRKISADHMDKIHWWIKCLKDEGIYVWIDLHVGREVTRADDVDAIDEMVGERGRAGMQGYLFANPSLQERFSEYANDYLSAKSPYTGLTLKDDPAVVGVLITNENDLSAHFVYSLLPPEQKPWHAGRYLELAQASKAAKGLDTSALLRPWEHGPVRLVLGDIEHRFFETMKDRLRNLGVKAPLVGTNFWGEMPASSLPSLAADDMIDVHVYGQANEIQYNPRFRPNALSWIAAGAIAGKPLSVSEWNVHEPLQVFDRFLLPLHIAAIARFQDWAAMMHFAYSHDPFLGDSGIGAWSAYNDPAMLATLSAGALLFREGHVKEGVETTVLQLPLEAVSSRHTDPTTSRAMRTLVERTKTRIGLPEIPGLDWHQATPTPPGATVIKDVEFDAIGPGTTKVCNDTNEICRDWDAGVLTIDTPRSQIAGGWIGGKAIDTRDVTFRINQSNAAIAVQSLGADPITKADELLISMTAQVKTAIPGRGPYRSEPLTGEIGIRARPGLKLYRMDLNGEAVPGTTIYRDGRYVIQLRSEEQGHWWVLR